MIERTEAGDLVTLCLAHGKANALDLELCEELRRQLAAARHAHAVILTGRGSIFSAGVDLHRLANDGKAYVERFLPALEAMLEELFEFPRPVIAAVNGHAIAGGCVITCACDYRVMSGGTIGMTELRVGLPFPTIVMDILKFAAGREAQSLAYSAPTVSPVEARQRGLIDEVVPADQLMARAAEVAARFAAIPHDSFRLTKLQLRRNRDVNAEVRDIWTRPETLAHVKDYMARTVGKRVSS